MDKPLLSFFCWIFHETDKKCNRLQFGWLKLQRIMRILGTTQKAMWRLRVTSMENVICSEEKWL